MTDHEKELVARRAYGEYAVNEQCTRIWEKYRKKLRGSIYIEFLRVIHKKSYSWEEYEVAARSIHKEHPREPSPAFGPEPGPEPEHEGLLADRDSILEALRRPWPRRGLSDEKKS